MHSLNIKIRLKLQFASGLFRTQPKAPSYPECTFSEVRYFHIKENNNHLIKNNYKTTFSLPQKVRLIQKQIIKCACGHDFIICLTKELKPYCYFQSAVHNVYFKQAEKIVDIATSQNFILFLTQKGQLYGTQFIAQKLVNDSLRPKLIKLNFDGLGFKERIIQKINIVDDLIFLHMKNNLILYLKRNDWTETKTFSDPEIVNASKNLLILDIASSKQQYFFLTKEGKLYTTTKNELNSGCEQIEVKQKLKKIAANQSQIYGISDEGSILKIHLKKMKAKCENISRLCAPFVDLVLGNENYYSITYEQQAWVWGKNAHGQLGLSDYEPRNSLYPLVSMEKFYIKQIFTGDNYVCCIVDDTRIRQSNKLSEGSSVRSPIREVKALVSQNPYLNEYRDSFNQTEEFLMPIRYTEDESKHSSCTDNNESGSEVYVIVNKKKPQEKDNLFKRSTSKTQKQPRLVPNSSHQRSVSRPKIQSKVSNKKCADNSCSKSKGKSVTSQSKLTPKSSKRQKSFVKDDKQKKSEYYVSTISDAGKSQTKSHKKQQIVSFKSPFKPTQEIQKTLREKIRKELKAQFDLELQNKQKMEDHRIQNLKALYEREKQILLQKIHRAEIQLKNKTQENKDLFDLISHKNHTIEDITRKIKLLQEAIEQHEKTLTARDNEAEQYFLRQKQYQLHIQKLESQVQKMMDVLNYNQRNRQAEVYKKEMERLSNEIKDRIEGEKQYYRERIHSLERKFEEEKNVYELQIRSLQDELALYKKKQLDLIKRLKIQKGQPASIELSMPCGENQSERCLESPTFHTLDIKQKIKNKINQNLGSSQSQLTLHNHVQQKQTFPLKESNRQDIYFSPLQKNQNEVRTRKNSKNYNLSQGEEGENYLNDKPDSQVKQMLEKIEMNKTCITKSANKLFNLLQNSKLSEKEQSLTNKF